MCAICRLAMSGDTHFGQVSGENMISGLLRISLVTGALTLLAFVANAKEPKDDGQPSKATVALSSAVDALRRAHQDNGSTIVVQSELDPLIAKEGGGSCPTCTAVNSLQLLRILTNREALPNPHKAALNAFSAEPKLLKGRLKNSQVVHLLEFFEQDLDGANLDVTVQTSPGYEDEGRPWGDQGPDLDTNANELKILSFTVTKPDGHVDGRHFVVLKGREKNNIAVVDFRSPMKDHRYVLEYKKSELAENIDVILRLPPDVKPKADTYTLNTVFTVFFGQKASSVEEIKARIDQAAKILKERDELTSPRVWRRTTAEFGLPGLDLPKDHGGSDWPVSKMLEVFRHVGRHNLNLRDVVGGAHVRPLLKSDSTKVRGYVRQIADGKGYMAIAITEPEVGSNVRGIRSTARKVDGGYLINGAKRYNARLDQASHVIIFTQCAKGPEGKLSVFVLPIETPGLEVERLKAHGLTGNSYGGLKFKDLFVPDDQLVGEDGEGMSVFADHFAYWRLMQTAAAIGTAERALELMADRLKTREVFGAPIGRFSHLQQPLGQHHTELKMAYSLAKEAAAMMDEGNYEEAYPLVVGLKAEGVEIALKTVDAATRAFGGEGYSDRVDLGDRLRDLNGLRIADGTTDVMRMEVVRRIYGEELWDMAVER